MNNVLQIVDRTGRTVPLNETLVVADHFAKSGLFNDAKTQSQAFVKIKAGEEMGFGPFLSMNGLHVMNGRVTVAANLMAAQIKASGRYRYEVTEHTNEGCSINFFEKMDGNWKPCGTSKFDSADAAAAGLTGGNWAKYRRNMMFARAIANGQRWYCPDVFSGPVYTPDELGIEVNEQGDPVTIDVPPEPELPKLPAPPHERIPEDEGQVIEENPDAAFTLGQYRQLVLTCVKKTDIKLTGPILSLIIGRQLDGKAGDEFPKLNRCELYLVREYIATGKLATTVPSEVIEAHNND